MVELDSGARLHPSSVPSRTSEPCGSITTSTTTTLAGVMSKCIAGRKLESCWYEHAPASGAAVERA
jgi:phage tail sheath gpL-like